MDIVRKHKDISSSLEYGAELKRIYPTQEVDTPFGSALVSVKPGQSTKLHEHHENETFIVISGSGVFRLNGKQAQVSAGDVLYIEAFSEHSIEASGEGDLLFASIWWEQPAVKKTSNGSYVIFTPPPTPNGDLHLGHISGPYISADVIKRYLLSTGSKATLIAGTDKSQSYVRLKSKQLGVSAQEVYEGFTKSIVHTFKNASMNYDTFYDCEDVEHEKFASSFVEKMLRAQLMRIETVEFLYCKQCEHEVFEAFAVGSCPHCGARSNGCVCEDCGTPNNSYDLGDVKCTTCGESPTRKEREKGILDLSMCRLAFKDATSGMALSQKLSNYLCAQNEMSISKYVVTFESDWGMPCTQPELKGQIYLGWLEMAAGYISAIYQSLFGSKPKSVDEAINRINESDFSVVHLMGFDNSFYYAYLYPLLFASLGLKSLNISFVVNEFLLLSGEKFSTSRNHAIWANEVFKDEVSSDWYRFYLSVKKPENLRENYVPEEFEMFQSTLSKKIQCVYDNHMARLRDYPLVGLTGTLSQTPDSEFSSYLNDQREKLTAYMTPAKGYSVKGYASVLVNLIDAIESHQRTSVIAGGRESLTGLRAEHEAIKLLHASLQPIAPNLAECFAIGKF